MDLIRYEPFFGKHLFSYKGDLYVVDGPVEQGEGSLVVMQSNNPHNGLSVPTRVQIQVTNRCNFRCPHCYAASGRASAREFSDSEIRSLLDECQKEGVLQIEWSGGEPFMRRGFVALLQYAHSLGFEQNLLTNGSILGSNPSLVQDVWKYVYAVQVSLNGYDKRFDAWVRRSSWRSVLEGIRLLVAEKPDHGEVSIATTLDRTNINDLESIGAILCNLDVDAWTLARQVHNGRSAISEDEADELLHSSYEMLHKMRRQGSLSLQVLHPFDKDEWNEDETILPVEWITESAARTFLYVSAGGSVYPFPYYDRCPEWMAGNVHDSSLLDLWRSEPFTRMRSVTREDTGCSGCKKVCRLWSRWFNYGRGQNIYESPMQHTTCTSRGQKP